MKIEIIKVKHVKPFQEELSKSSLRVIADVYVWIAVTEICFEKKTKEPVVGTFRDICTEALHCWYKKKSLCRISLTNFWKKKKFEDNIVVDHLKSKFTSKSSSPLKRCKSFM